MTAKLHFVVMELFHPHFLKHVMMGESARMLQIEIAQHIVTVLGVSAFRRATMVVMRTVRRSGVEMASFNRTLGKAVIEAHGVNLIRRTVQPIQTHARTIRTPDHRDVCLSMEKAVRTVGQPVVTVSER
jgi:hypothetical protein